MSRSRHTATIRQLRTIRADARTALFYSSNWITVILVGFALMLLLWGAWSVSDRMLSIASGFIEIPSIAGTVLHVLLYLLLTPLILGYISFCTDLIRVSRGDGSGRVPPTVVFSVYTSGRSIIRAWLCLPLQLLPWLIYAVCVVLGNRFFPLTGLGGIVSASVYTTVLVFSAVLLLLTCLFFSTLLSPLTYLCVTRPELSLRAIASAMRSMTRYTVLQSVLLQLSLLTALALSVLLTAGVAAFLYVLPIGLFEYLCLCESSAHRTDSAL